MKVYKVGALRRNGCKVCPIASYRDSILASAVRDVGHIDRHLRRLEEEQQAAALAAGYAIAGSLSACRIPVNAQFAAHHGRVEIACHPGEPKMRQVLYAGKTAFLPGASGITRRRPAASMRWQWHQAAQQLYRASIESGVDGGHHPDKQKTGCMQLPWLTCTRE